MQKKIRMKNFFLSWQKIILKILFFEKKIQKNFQKNRKSGKFSKKSKIRKNFPKNRKSGKIFLKIENFKNFWIFFFDIFFCKTFFHNKVFLFNVLCSPSIWRFVFVSEWNALVHCLMPFNRYRMTDPATKTEPNRPRLTSGFSWSRWTLKITRSRKVYASFSFLSW